MNAVLDSIDELPGVAGVVHHRRDLVLYHRLPEALPLHSAVALCTAVHRAFGAYAGAGRALREAWFEFPQFSVLVIARPSESPDEFLTLMISDRASAAAAARSAGQFWKSR
jgi:hypothetical protein